jgi:hypothetical protein
VIVPIVNRLTKVGTATGCAQVFLSSVVTLFSSNLL